MSISTAFWRLLCRTPTLSMHPFVWSLPPARPIFASQMTRSYSRNSRPSRGLRPGDLIGSPGQTESKRRREREREREREASQISISYRRNSGGPSRRLTPGDLVDFAGPTESKRRRKREAKIKAGVDLDNKERGRNVKEKPSQQNR